MKKINVGNFRNLGIVQKRYDLTYPEEDPVHYEDFASIYNGFFSLTKNSAFERSMQQASNVSADYTAVGYYDNRINNGDRIIFFPEDIVAGRRSISDSVFRIESISAVETKDRFAARYMELQLTSGVFTNKTTVYPKENVKMCMLALRDNNVPDTVNEFLGRVETGQVLPTMSNESYINNIFNQKLVLTVPFNAQDWQTLANDEPLADNFVINPLPTLPERDPYYTLMVVDWSPTGSVLNIRRVLYEILYASNQEEYIGHVAHLDPVASYADVRGYDINVFQVLFPADVDQLNEQHLLKMRFLV